jgi:hypothetical protein
MRVVLRDCAQFFARFDMMSVFSKGDFDGD